MADVFTGDYVKTETGFKRVESLQLCGNEFIVVFTDGTVMLHDDVTIDNLFLESEVNL
jgi:hypothetical protein